MAAATGGSVTAKQKPGKGTARLMGQELASLRGRHGNGVTPGGGCISLVTRATVEGAVVHLTPRAMLLGSYLMQSQPAAQQRTGVGKVLE